MPWSKARRPPSSAPDLFPSSSGWPPAGSPKEVLRGQIPITDDDLMRIPEIVASYEALTTEKNKRGQDVIIYTKTMDDGITFHVEEILLGRHELAASTMYKRKKDDSPTLID